MKPLIISALLFSTLAMSMENENNSQPPAEIIWLYEQPDVILFNKDLSLEKAEKIVEDFWQAGFNDKWQYFWTSNDDMAIKITKAQSFYEDTKQYFINKDHVKDAQLLVRIGIMLSWAIDKTNDTRKLKDIYEISGQSPLAKVCALAHMSDRVLNEKEQVIDERIANVFGKISQLFLQDIQETKKILDK